MGELRVIRKFYDSPDPNKWNDLIQVDFQEDIVGIDIPGHPHRIYLSPLASGRLGDVLVNNRHIPGILAEVQRC